MPAEILTEDLLSVLLLLSEGDVSITLDEALFRLEHWQRAEDRHFGISQDDMRSAFGMLWFRNYPRPNGPYEFDEICQKTTLQEWIPYVLRYYELYCNDEGEHWHEKEDHSGLFEAGQAASFRNYEMRKFFREPVSRDSIEVMRFLKRLGVGADILFRCSRSGDRS